MVGTCHQIAIASNEKQFADDATLDIFSDWLIFARHSNKKRENVAKSLAGSIKRLQNQFIVGAALFYMSMLIHFSFITK